MLKTVGVTVFSMLLFVSAAVADAMGGGAGERAAGSAQASPARHSYLLHLPGIAGARWVDRQMVAALREGGYSGKLETYDWTGDDPGLSALHALKRNHVEAQKIADKLTAAYRADPSVRITITAHSGGTGLAAWALEDLPADVKVDTLILLSSALSPGYDLSKALSHVTGKAYSFCSENDVLVLGTGTTLFGTIDGKNCEAAGEYGFIYPATADPLQYEKLIQKPYNKEWMQFGNIGDHIGSMRPAFARNVIVPLIPGAQVAASARQPHAAHPRQTAAGAIDPRPSINEHVGE